MRYFIIQLYTLINSKTIKMPSKTDSHDITVILLKVAFNTRTLLRRTLNGYYTEDKRGIIQKCGQLKTDNDVFF
jgi:hypothetical protein